MSNNLNKEWLASVPQIYGDNGYIDGQVLADKVGISIFWGDEIVCIDYQQLQVWLPKLVEWLDRKGEGNA